FKALDEGFCSKNYARKFLWYLHPKWIAKVTTREESKDLSSLALNELIGNLKVHEVIMEKYSEICKGKRERVKSTALKAKKESRDYDTSTFGSDDEEYAMAISDFKMFLEETIDLVDNHVKRISHSRKGMIRKERVIGNVLDAVIRIILLANVQSLYGTKTKRHLLRVLGVTAKLKTRTKLTKKLVSWLNREMR
ncbi:hypothetical protein Tco_0847038, partial [Tanacetum coccineum]